VHFERPGMIFAQDTHHACAIHVSIAVGDQATSVDQGHLENSPGAHVILKTDWQYDSEVAWSR